MLDSFLETNIQNKLKIFSSLFLQYPVSIKYLSNKLNLSIPSIHVLINELNADFKNIAKIEKNNNHLLMTLNENYNQHELVYNIYKHSDILNCLKFLLTNNKNIPFSQFIENEYLTKSSAYRIRQRCSDYLYTIGLDIKYNRIVGEEYRIRFLIALLYCKYGVNCCDIDENSIKIAREYILSTNQSIDMNYIIQTESIYKYFETLLIISWKRKNHTVDLSNSMIFRDLKKLFFYKKIENSVKEIIEPKLKIKFDENDFDYIYLAYCTTINCLFNDRWTCDNFLQIRDIVFSNEVFTDLLKKLEKQFGKEIINSPIVIAILITFYKKFLLNLQCIIPDKHFYLNLKKDIRLPALFKLLANIFHSWKIDNNIKYEVNESHLYYLSLQLEVIIRQLMPPICVFVVSGLPIELEILRLYIGRNFSDKRISIIPLLFTNENKEILENSKDCIIITHKKFEKLVSHLKIDKSNTIMPISIEMNIDDIDNINNVILSKEENIFNNFVNSKNKNLNNNIANELQNEIKYKEIQEILMN